MLRFIPILNKKKEKIKFNINPVIPIKAHPLSHAHLRFGILGIINLCPVVPIGWLRSFRVRDFLGGQEIPIFLQGPALSLLVVYFNLVSVVWTNNESVEVSELIIFAANLSLYQEVLPFVVEYDVDFLGSRAADVGSWRGVVLGAWFGEGRTYRT